MSENNNLKSDEIKNNLPHSPKRECKVYLLTNKVNGMIYVGQTWMEDYKTRMGGKGGGYQNSPRIYEAIQKYGVENFEYQTLAICLTQAEADRVEDGYILQFDSRSPEIGYNKQRGGSHGFHHEDTKKLISESLTGRKASEESRAKMSKAQKGLKKPLRTEEVKKQTSESLVKWHAENEHPMQGKHHTEETKAKISKSTKGKSLDPAVVAKRAKFRISVEKQDALAEAYKSGENLDDIAKKYKVSLQTIFKVVDDRGIEKMGNFKKWTGRKHTKETKEKMSESAKKLWTERKEDKNGSEEE